MLASLGAEVTLIERVPAVHAALANAIALGRGGPPDVAAVLGRMILLAGDARDLLASLAPDVVLVDPMHPDRGNSALVRAEMRRLRAMVGPDADSVELMAAALAAARRRVVLKWPRHAPSLPGLRPPSHSIAGRTTRYDVFVRA